MRHHHGGGEIVKDDGLTSEKAVSINWGRIALTGITSVTTQDSKVSHFVVDSV
ncbi:hypothetical protein GIB67_001282 [Kingdonia uniflora]|uniref:Uncharacterized protein n=1 Tax=Kingdonia uniflora TaxID=39325 RepID=A0A7J7LLD4_9MAGN|nr:hypothetical protein GIB67_001282 [Kingdonia uniflora]